MFKIIERYLVRRKGRKILKNVRFAISLMKRGGVQPTKILCGPETTRCLIAAGIFQNSYVPGISKIDGLIVEENEIVEKNMTYVI